MDLFITMMNKFFFKLLSIAQPVLSLEHNHLNFSFSDFERIHFTVFCLVSLLKTDFFEFGLLSYCKIIICEISVFSSKSINKVYN